MATKKRRKQTQPRPAQPADYRPARPAPRPGSSGSRHGGGPAGVRPTNLGQRVDIPSAPPAVDDGGDTPAVDTPAVVEALSSDGTAATPEVLETPAMPEVLATAAEPEVVGAGVSDQLDVAAPAAPDSLPTSPVRVLTVDDLLDLADPPRPLAAPAPRPIPGKAGRRMSRRQRRAAAPAPFIPPHQRISRRRRRREYRQLGFVELAPVQLKRRHRILPRTVIGISVCAMFFGVGAGLSAVTLYTHFTAKLAASDARTEAMVTGMEKTYRESIAEIQAARVEALSDVATSLAMARSQDATWHANGVTYVVTASDGRTSTLQGLDAGAVVGQRIDLTAGSGATAAGTVISVGATGLVHVRVEAPLPAAGVWAAAPNMVVFAPMSGSTFRIAAAGPLALWSTVPGADPPASVPAQPLFAPSGALAGWVDAAGAVLPVSA